MTPDAMAILSLILLAGIIVLGFVRNINLGLCAMLFAFVLGKVGGMNERAIIAGFNTQLFVMLLGITFFFGILRENRTLPLIIHKCIRLAGKKTYIFPPLVFLISLIASAAGPGPIPVMSLLIPLSVSLSNETGHSPVMMTAQVMLGAGAGGNTPCASNGIVIASLMQEQGYSGFEWSLFTNVLLIYVFLATILFIFFKGYKASTNSNISFDEDKKFEPQNIFSVVLTLIMLVIVFLAGLNVGLCGFAAGVVLLVFFPRPERSIFSSIPWGTLILVSGMSVYLNVVVKVGGINMLSNGLASAMTPITATALIALIAGILSWFSSTIGVVLPTLVPIIPGLTVAMGGAVTDVQLLSSMTAAAMAAGVSPMSTGGGLSVAAFSSLDRSDRDDRRHFARLFFTSAALIILIVLTQLVLSILHSN